MARIGLFFLKKSTLLLLLLALGGFLARSCWTKKRKGGNGISIGMGVRNAGCVV